MTILLTIIGVLAVCIGMLVLFTWWTARKVESVLPSKGRFIDVPGARLHIREFGEAGRPPGDPADPRPGWPAVALSPMASPAAWRNATA
jgi:hypothetical protein